MPTQKLARGDDVSARNSNRESRPPRLHLRLSARGLEKLPPGRHPDGDGFMLQVTKSGGSRSWVLRTVVHGRRRDIGLGSLQHLPLARAGEEARHLRGIARAGGDPIAARDKRRSPILPFRKAAAAVHAQHEKS